MRNEVRVVTALLVLASAVGPSWSADPKKVPRPADKTTAPQQTRLPIGHGMTRRSRTKEDV
jgi:hypothetical protein